MVEVFLNETTNPVLHPGILTVMTMTPPSTIDIVAKTGC